MIISSIQKVKKKTWIFKIMINKLEINRMIHVLVKYLSTIIICLHCTPVVRGDYEEFLENIKIEEMYQTLGPKELISTFVNETTLKNLSDSACSRDLISYTIGIREQESWAVKSKCIYIHYVINLHNK